MLFTSNMGVWQFLTNVFSVIDTYSSAMFVWIFVIGSPFVVLYIQQKTVINLVIVYLFLGGVLVMQLPAQASGPALMMLLMGITGIVFHVFKKESWG